MINQRFLGLMGLRILVAALIIFSIFVVLLYSAQDKMLFLPQGISLCRLSEIRKYYNNVEDVKIRSKDGTIVQGWMVKASGFGRSPLIIYFGGNAEEVSYLIPEFDKFSPYSMALMNYRGYGLSDGTPSEKALFEDAIAIYDYFSSRADVDSKRIILIGRSLGSGVAVYLAQNRSVKGLILVTPYDSIKSLAQETFPYLPVSLLLKHPFDSIARAPSVKAPLLALAAGNDEIIPPHHARRLVDKWGGPHTLKILEGAGHNTIDSAPEYWPSIKNYLSGLGPTSVTGAVE